MLAYMYLEFLRHYNKVGRRNSLLLYVYGQHGHMNFNEVMYTRNTWSAMCGLVPQRKPDWVHMKCGQFNVKGHRSRPRPLYTKTGQQQ